VEPVATRFGWQRAKRTTQTFFCLVEKTEMKDCLMAARLRIPTHACVGESLRFGKEYGLGTAKAALEIGRRLGLSQLDEKYRIKSPADAANLVIAEFTHRDRDERPMCRCERVTEN
jgi:hypothetical protein